MNEDEDLDIIWDDEHSIGLDGHPSKSKAARGPTIPELNAQITTLERENFQLKLRVHMNETRGSVDPITVNTAITKKSQRELQIEKEVEVLRVEKQQLEFKLHQKQSQLAHEVQQKEEALGRESSLQNKIEELKTFINIFEREKALNRLRNGPLGSPYISSPQISGLFTPVKVSKAVGVDSEIEPELRNTMTHEDNSTANWYRKYNQASETLQMTEEELRQVRLELESSNYDRLQLRNQLEKSDDEHKRELMKTEVRFEEKLDKLQQEITELKITNDELKASLEKSKTKVESLKKAANLELSNQLYYHQTALEKVHQEQAHLIAELQNLKRACPIQKPVQDLCKKVDLIEDIDLELESNTKCADLTEILLRPLKPEKPSSEDVSICLIDLETPRNVLKSSVAKERDGRVTLLNKELHEKNSKLAIKLKTTKESLKQAIAMLEHSEKDKEGMEKIICRQLHRTHMILADVKGALQSNISSPEGSRSPRTCKQESNHCH